MQRHSAFFAVVGVLSYNLYNPPAVVGAVGEHGRTICSNNPYLFLLPSLLALSGVEGFVIPYSLFSMFSSKKWYWSFPLLWAAFITYMSLLPGSAGIMTLFGIPHFDKILHLGGYGMLAFLSAFASWKSSGPSRIWTGMILFVCIVIGCLLEIGQYYMHAGRSFELWDMLANAVGVIGGVILFKIVRIRFH